MYMPLIRAQRDDLSKEPIDILSKMYEERVIFLTGEIDDEMASSICAQLLYLDSLNNEEIVMYINSPGGVITSGLSIYDVMTYIKSPIKTVAMGQACSMGSFLLAMGNERVSFPTTRIMIHQPSGGAYGQQSDISIQAQEILRLREILEEKYAERSNGKSTVKKINKLCERDSFLSPQEALEIGLIDRIAK